MTIHNLWSATIGSVAGGRQLVACASWGAIDRPQGVTIRNCRKFCDSWTHHHAFHFGNKRVTLQRDCRTFGGGIHKFWFSLNLRQKWLRIRAICHAEARHSHYRQRIKWLWKSHSKSYGIMTILMIFYDFWIVKWLYVIIVKKLRPSDTLFTGGFELEQVT